MFIHEVTITGNGPFPTDMLRYDGCCPGDSDAVSAINAEQGENWYGRFINYTSCKSSEPFTVDRWASFGAKVHTDSLRTLKV